MKIFTLITFATIFLLGCGAPRGDHQTEHRPSLYQENYATDHKPVFVSLKSLELQQPREEEKAYLKQISFMVNQLLTLVSKAQSDTDDSGRIVFDYNTMLLDLQAIHFGINQYFLTRIRSPRLPPSQINDYSVQGNYVRLRN